MSEPRIGVSVVTMGDRPEQVEALLASVAMQDVRPSRVVVVGNGSPLPDYGAFPGLTGLGQAGSPCSNSTRTSAAPAAATRPSTRSPASATWTW